jgi:hypothetical protein
MVSGFTPVTVELVPIREGETRVMTKGFDLDTGLEQVNESVMSDTEADAMADGMLDYGWQEVPIQLR